MSAENALASGPASGFWSTDSPWMYRFSPFAMPDPCLIHLPLSLHRLEELRPLFEVVCAKDIVGCHQIMNGTLDHIRSVDYIKELGDDMQRALLACADWERHSPLKLPKPSKEIMKIAPLLVETLGSLQDTRVRTAIPELCYVIVKGALKRMHEHLCPLGVRMCECARTRGGLFHTPIPWDIHASRSKLSETQATAGKMVSNTDFGVHISARERVFSDAIEEHMDFWSREIHDGAREHFWDPDV